MDEAEIGVGHARRGGLVLPEEDGRERGVGQAIGADQRARHRTAERGHPVEEAGQPLASEDCLRDRQDVASGLRRPDRRQQELPSRPGPTVLVSVEADLGALATPLPDAHDPVTMRTNYLQGGVICPRAKFTPRSFTASLEGIYP